MFGPCEPMASAIGLRCFMLCVKEEKNIDKSRTHICLLLIACWSLTHVANSAEPYIPSSDAEILETLPKSLISDELTTLRRQLSASPTDIRLAVAVAERYLSMGNMEGDPRFYGYARAALKPWWSEQSPPAAILKLRAKLHEKEHLYDTALADLRKLLEQQPQDPQAWIEVANILRVQGKYDEAWQACDALSKFGGDVPTALCRIPLQAVTGQAAAAKESLKRILPLAKSKFPSTVQWLLTMQTKIAYALGDIDQAERYFKDGLANNPQDQYLLRDYADFLLDQNRNDEAFELLREHIKDNGILLRAAIAAKRVGENQLAKNWTSQLATRFEEIRLRGGIPHGRFEARYELELHDDPQRALVVALDNWQKQKETRDTRNVLEAAIASGDTQAAKPVVAFLAEHGTEDVILQRLVKELEAK